MNQTADRMIPRLETDFCSVVIEVLSLAILAAVARLLLLEKDLSSGAKQLFGGFIFGTLIGILAYRYPPEFYFGKLITGLWRFWTAVAGIFGRELLFYFRQFAVNPPLLRKFFKNDSRTKSDNDGV